MRFELLEEFRERIARLGQFTAACHWIPRATAVADHLQAASCNADRFAALRHTRAGPEKKSPRPRNDPSRCESSMSAAGPQRQAQ